MKKERFNPALLGVFAVFFLAASCVGIANAGLPPLPTYYPAKGSIVAGKGTKQVTSLAVGTDTYVLTADSTQTTGLKWAVATGGSSSYELTNVGLAASVGSSALTLALKQLDGSTNCSAGSPCKIGFRSATTTSGSYSQVSVTGALSTVISSGSTAGCTSAVSCTLYVYTINNAGTAELAWSQKLFPDEGNVITTTAEGGAGAADSATVMYSTTARTGVAFRLVGKVVSTQATAGTWATSPSLLSLVPMESGNGPTIQRFTTGSGTYTTPAGVKWLRVKIVGGGGGGGGGSTSGNGGAGGGGGNTTFGTSLLTANGGGGGLPGSTSETASGGGGGAATVASPAIEVWSMTGVSGGQGTSNISGEKTRGGPGGGTPLSPGGPPGNTTGAGVAGITNSGAGGGGAGGPGGGYGAGGGGAGGYVEAIINAPSASYSYAIGASGTAGSAGTGGSAGGEGAAGLVIVEEHYN